MQDIGARQADPTASVPTGPERGLRWDAALPPGHPYKLSNGNVSRTMARVRKAHLQVTANIFRQLFQGIDPELAGRNNTITFGSLDVELAMSGIFHGIPDAPTVERGAYSRC